MKGPLSAIAPFALLLGGGLASAPGAAATSTASGSENVLLNPFDLDATSLHLFEIFLSGLVALYCLNFAVGVRRNLVRARAAADALDRTLAPQFASVGVAAGAGKRLLRDGASEFWYYATGRLRTSGFAAHLVFRPRQDLFALVGGLVRVGPEETMTVLAPIDAAMEPVSVLLLAKRELVRVREAGGGVALRAAQRLAAEIGEFGGLEGNCVVMAEHAECVGAILTQAVTEELKGIGGALRSVHVSEFQAHWDAQCEAAKKFVRVRVVLPEDAQERERVVVKTAQAVCALVDVAASARLSGAAKKKAVELRRTILAEEERERQKIRREEMADRREAKKKEEEEKVGKMSAEKQAKHDEKKRKKAFKARLKKVTTK